MTAISVHQLLTPSKKNKPGNKPGNKAVNIKSGNVTESRSWVLDRISRDWGHWKPHEVWQDGEEKHRQRAVADSGTRPPHTTRESNQGQNAKAQAKARAEDDKDGVGDDDEVEDVEYTQTLHIILFHSGTSHKQARPFKDHLWYSAVTTAVLQHGIAAILCVSNGNWAPLMIAFIGTVLAFTTGALPHSGKEKWDCKRRSNKTVALMRSNVQGLVSDISVVRGQSKESDLEDMAKGGWWHTQTSRKAQVTKWPWTRITTGIQAACWIELLITAAEVVGNQIVSAGDREVRLGTECVRCGIAENTSGKPCTPGV